MISSDSENYYTPYELVQQYLRQKSAHTQDGEGAIEDEVLSEGENMSALPILNAEEDDDYEGSPISATSYEQIPLSDDFSDIISIFIKRTSFVRQKEWGLSDHLFRVIFVPKKETNEVILLTSLLGAIHEVIAYCLRRFKNYYTPREKPSDFPTQCYLKITEKHLEASKVSLT
jgi:hypothetical protein